MLKELQDFGLSEKEAKVYLASLEIGRATADQLAKQAKVNRSTTYVQIESLMKKGLMSTYEEGKKTYFAPESPELLKRLLQIKKDSIRNTEQELEAQLPELIRYFEGAGERPTVRYFFGKEGLTAVREEILNVKNKKLEVIFSPGDLGKIYSNAELEEYSQRREKLGIHSRGIYTFQAYFEKATESPLTERRFLPPERLKFMINLAIYDDCVAVLSFKGKLFGLIIRNSQIADSMRSLFAFLWESAAEK